MSKVFRSMENNQTDHKGSNEKKMSYWRLETITKDRTKIVNWGTYESNLILLHMLEIGYKKLENSSETLNPYDVDIMANEITKYKPHKAQTVYKFFKLLANEKSGILFECLKDFEGKEVQIGKFTELTYTTIKKDLSYYYNFEKYGYDIPMAELVSQLTIASDNFFKLKIKQ